MLQSREKGGKIETNRRETTINKRHMHCNRRAIYDSCDEMGLIESLRNVAALVYFHFTMIYLIPMNLQ